MAKRLYVITRSDLSPGMQAAQSVHAAMTWMEDHPGKKSHRTVVVLSVPCQHDLMELSDTFFEEFGSSQVVKISEWYEEDLAVELTAFAVAVGKKHYYLFEKYPLALGNKNGQV